MHQWGTWGTLLGVYICAGSRMSLIVYQGDKFLGYKSTQIISKYPNNLANLRKLSLLIEMPYFVYMTCIVKETTSQWLELTFYHLRKNINKHSALIAKLIAHLIFTSHHENACIDPVNMATLKIKKSWLSYWMG